jgi:hypothetical protein
MFSRGNCASGSNNKERKLFEMRNFAAISLLLLAIKAFGQSEAPAPTPTPIPQGAINFSANFSSFGSVASVNGNSNVTANIYSTWFPITTNTGKLGNVAGRFDAIQMPGQSTSIYLLGLEKSWLGGKILPLNRVTFDSNKFWIAAFAEAGGKRQDTTRLPSFSVRAGVVLRRKLTDMIGVNLAEVSYLRTNIGTPTSTGVVLFSGPSNWTAGAGLHLNFGPPK